MNGDWEAPGAKSAHLHLTGPVSASLSRCKFPEFKRLAGTTETWKHEKTEGAMIVADGSFPFPPSFADSAGLSSFQHLSPNCC